MPNPKRDDDEGNELSSKVTKLIDSIRKPFTAFVKGFTALAQSREELAPKFMKAFGAWQAVTGGSFVDFVRYLVPEVGTSRNEYRNHRAYQAADYLRRIVASNQRRERQPVTPEQRATAPSSPQDAMARLIKSIIPLVPEDQRARIWEAMYVQLHWTDRQVTRIQNMVSEVNPLIIARAPRGQELPVLRITVPQALDEAEPVQAGAHAERAGRAVAA